MTSALAIVPPEPLDTSALSADAALLIRDAEAIIITDEESYIAACNFGKGVKALQKKIKDFFAPSKKRWDDGHSAECAREREQLTPTEKAERIVKDKVSAWQKSERERAEKERRRLESEARRLEEERQLQRALDAEAEGDWPETVEEILSEPIETPIVRMPAPKTKVSGVSTQKRWTFELVDFAAVVRHIAGVPDQVKLAHPELLKLLSLDSVATRQRVIADGEHFNVKGIRAYQAEDVSFGSK